MAWGEKGKIILGIGNRYDNNLQFVVVERIRRYRSYSSAGYVSVVRSHFDSSSGHYCSGLYRTVVARLGCPRMSVDAMRGAYACTLAVPVPRMKRATSAPFPVLNQSSWNTWARIHEFLAQRATAVQVQVQATGPVCSHVLPVCQHCSVRYPLGTPTSAIK